MMEERRKYDPQTASELFAELLTASQAQPDYLAAYRQLNQVFLQCLNENTRFAGIRFSGPFSKTDYLLKENHAPRALQQSVNDARVRLREYRRKATDQLGADFAYDLKAISQFVALVYHLPVPDVLEAQFPPDRHRQRGALKAACLRVIVLSWDDTYIYGQADAEDWGEVKVFYGGKSQQSIYPDWDWSYLSDCLREGGQLNVVRPRQVDDVLYAELLIWEPDFLVDISAIAACFENYAVSPLIHLLNKLKPSVPTQPIVLGNLAGQLLDECLCSTTTDGPPTYEQSVQTFFKRNAISLLTAGIDKDFHQQARSQQQIIQQTLRQKLPQLLGQQGMRFDATQMMVEPSFFSEMLGLQGRMDLMHLGQQLLVEQKSGKAQYPETDPPKAVQKHYVQLLLYMLLLRYNFRDVYDRSGHRLFAFLLYSKYQNGLLPLGFAPDLIFQAVRVRNGIAAAEYRYSLEGFGILCQLTADSLNQHHVHGPLWERYQKPQIDALLQPIHQASELERAYYLRLLRFIQTEHLMAKVGTQTKENAGFADKWNSTLEEKVLAGNIYYGLRLLSPDATEQGKVQQLTLAIPNRSSAAADHAAEPLHSSENFRVGDIVILYPYTEGDEPDARRTMVFRATIQRIEAAQLVLSLRAQQVSATVFWNGVKGRCWAVEHDFFESSFASLYRGMHAFLTASCERRQLMLMQREPQIDATQRLVGDYGPFNELALRVKQARDLFLIIGPPGTGKTSYGLLSTLQEELASSADNAVLLLAYTNRAVDEICSKLIESGIDFIRIGGRFACQEDCRPYLLDTRAEQCTRLEQLRTLVERARVVVGTTTSLSANVHLLRLRPFSLAIIDEASQLLEPHLMPLLSATTEQGDSAIRKLVMIGDHKQLPAVVQQSAVESAVSEPLLRAIGLTDCRLSLFERLLSRHRHNPAVVYMLTRQGRMHADIALFPSTAFYQGLLQPVPLPHQVAPLQRSTFFAERSGRAERNVQRSTFASRLAFVAVAPAPHPVSDKVNAAEAQAIAEAVAAIHEHEGNRFVAGQTVGVIVPYRCQIAEVRRCLEAYAEPQLMQVTVDTVERFQGSQRDYIIYGFTVQRHYQLSFLTNNVFTEDGATIDRKLNVAMTRARLHLWLFGNPQLLSQNSTFASLLQFIKDRGGYIVRS